MKILVVVGSKSDLSITGKGLEVLRRWQISHSLRVASAHRSAEFLNQIVENFVAQQGQVIVCVAGKAAHLAGVVAAKVTLPVIAVPVNSGDVGGLDALLAMAQMPSGIPVATMGFGSHGFINACLLASQILALQDSSLQQELNNYRQGLSAETKTADEQQRIDFA